MKFRSLLLAALTTLTSINVATSMAWARETSPAPYEMLETINLINGSRCGSILIPENTPYPAMEAAARQAAKVNQLFQVGVYCSREAWKADFSAKAQRLYPGELERCALGMLEGALFQSR